MPASSPAQLVFTPGNWNMAQSVAVSAVDDAWPKARTWRPSPTQRPAATGNYNGIGVTSVTVNITDNDSAGVAVTPTTVNVTEGGGNSSYSVVLASQPTGSGDHHAHQRRPGEHELESHWSSRRSTGQPLRR